MPRSFIACCLWGILWGIVSSKVGISFTDLSFWIVSLLGCSILQISIRD